MSTTVTIPTFETERLRLRCPRLSDLDAYADFRASERAVHVGGPIGRGQSFDKLCAMIGHWHLRGYGRWIIADKTDDTPLGMTGLMFPEGWPEPEIAWSLFAKAEGRGIALEAALAARAYAYDTLGWTRLISCIAPANTRSVVLAERMGAARERTFDLPGIGPLDIWRHPQPGDLA